MKILFLIIGLTSICFLGCKKESTVPIKTFNGDGFIYTDGSEFGAGGIGWYFAETRSDPSKVFPLKESQLAAEFKSITSSDSIAVTVSLRETKAAVGCDCPAGVYYYSDIISISKR